MSVSAEQGLPSIDARACSHGGVVVAEWRRLAAGVNPDHPQCAGFVSQPVREFFAGGLPAVTSSNVRE